jgi:hypothetical protein
MTDAACAADAAAHFEQDLRQLRGLARAGFAADHDHAMLLDGGLDVVAACADRQRRIEADAAD